MLDLGSRVALWSTTANFLVPVSAILSLAGGGYIYEEDVSSGTVNMTANVGTIAIWSSSTSSAKTNFIPTSKGTKNIITIVDAFGDAYTNNITTIPLSGNIIGNAVCYTNFSSITLYDSSLGWVSI